MNKTLSLRAPFLGPFWREGRHWQLLLALHCASGLLWSLSRSLFSILGHIAEWCPNLLSFLFPGAQCRWPTGCSVFPGLCFIFQDISWLPCDQLFIVSQIMNPQEQTSSQTKWHYEKQTPDIGTSAKQMEFWKGGGNYFGKISMILLYTKCSSSSARAKNYNVRPL